MTYKCFEDLPVWQSAAGLYAQADDFLDAAPPRLSRSFRDQLERAALSVSNNISEGFERGTTNELLAFIYIARGSSGEVRSMLTILLKRPWIPAELKPSISKVIALAESCSRQLRGWAESLQNSPISGHRRLNDQARAEAADKKQREDGRLFFEKMLEEHLPPDHPIMIDRKKRNSPN